MTVFHELIQREWGFWDKPGERLSFPRGGQEILGIALKGGEGLAGSSTTHNFTGLETDFPWSPGGLFCKIASSKGTLGGYRL